MSRAFFLPALAGRSARLVLDIVPSDPQRFRSAAAQASASSEAVVAEPAATGASKPVVVIDPGHGGIDPGANTPDGLLEKDVVLDVSRMVAEDLAAAGGIEVHLTREDDRFLSLAQRIRIARAYGADLFVSVHADAAPQDYVRGATVYTLSERPSDKAAAALAAQENLADSVSGVIEPDRQETVSGILADLMRRETEALSRTFAEGLIGTLDKAVRINTNPHRSARFRVLMAHDFPSVLLELGYLTNADDASALENPAWRETASEAIAAAVEGFLHARHSPAAAGAGKGESENRGGAFASAGAQPG